MRQRIALASIVIALLSVLLSALLFASPALAQKGLTGKVVKMEPAQLTITLSAVMGHKDMKVKNAALIEKIKVGDTIQFVTAQEGNSLVITEIEVIKLP